MVDTQISMMITAGMSREEAEKEAIREFNEMHKEVYGTTNYKKGGLVKKKMGSKVGDIKSFQKALAGGTKIPTYAKKGGQVRKKTKKKK